MTDKPILFSGPMVRALLEGRKTQTRRVLKPTKDAFEAPKYFRGDRLWVREAWNAFSFSQDGDEAWPTKEIPTANEMREIREAAYRVDVQAIYKESDRARKWFSGQKWRPSIHMPRWASRLTLVVTDVRVQRMQEISEADAIAEGCRGFVSRDGEDGESPREEFHALWDSLDEERGFGWASNPWVAAYTFTVHKCNIDQMEARDQ